MFPPKYFPPAYFAPKYFPPGGVVFKVFDAAAVIKAEQLGALDVAAVVRKPTSSSTTAFSIIRTENLAALSANAILVQSNTGSASIDALLREASTPFNVDAVLLSPAQGTFGLESLIGSSVPTPIEAITDLAELGALSTVQMLAFDGTAVFLDHQDTSSYAAFAGGVVEDQSITMVPGVQAEAVPDDIEFSLLYSWFGDFTPHNTAIDAEEATTVIDFAGGVKEVTDA